MMIMIFCCHRNDENNDINDAIEMIMPIRMKLCLTTQMVQWPHYNCCLKPRIPRDCLKNISSNQDPSRTYSSHPSSLLPDFVRTRRTFRSRFCPEWPSASNDASRMRTVPRLDTTAPSRVRASVVDWSHAAGSPPRRRTPVLYRRAHNDNIRFLSGHAHAPLDGDAGFRRAPEVAASRFSRDFEWRRSRRSQRYCCRHRTGRC